jgi:Predicted membrane protein
METKKSKYDTNPLDPDVERKSAETWGQGGGAAPTTPWVQEPTSDINKPGEDPRKNVYSEAPTRRYETPSLEAPYPSVFVPPPYAPPTQYQPPQSVYQAPAGTRPTSRPIAGMGLPEKWATTLPYAPFYVGLIVSLLELFLVPRREEKVRFHASQAIALHIGILIIHTLFGVISTITDSSLGGILFKMAAFVFLLISMIRVWKGEPHHIAPLAEPARWFNEKIEPRNQR